MSPTTFPDAEKDNFLFYNVVDPEGTEDVVGISKKLVEVLTEDLAGGDGAQAQAPSPEAGETPEEQPEAAREAIDPSSTQPPGRGAESGIEESIRRAILGIQGAFGPRIERILGSGGGLLVVMDRVDEETDRAAAAISGEVPIALIDPRTLSGLQRLGAASPVAGAQTLFEAPREREVQREPALLRQAREKINGAEVLIQQACPAPAADLLLSALLAAAAVRAGQEIPPRTATGGRLALWRRPPKRHPHPGPGWTGHAHHGPRPGRRRLARAHAAGTRVRRRLVRARHGRGCQVAQTP